MGVGWSGIAKGICEFEAGSRDTGDVCVSPPKKELPPAPGGMVEVGEGKTSLSLDGGSLRSLFHMPVPQGKVDPAGARPMTDEVECEPHVPAPVSADGVLGCDAVGDMELLANDPLRGRPSDCDVSFNHEGRRTGLGGCAACCADS